MSTLPISERNRFHLITALAAGVTVQRFSKISCYVNSRGNPARQHLVEINIDSNGTRFETCDCEWSQRQGTIVTGDGRLPCGHILIARWQLLDSVSRMGLLDADPELADAAYGPAVHGHLHCPDCGGMMNLFSVYNTRECMGCGLVITVDADEAAQLIDGTASVGLLGAPTVSTEVA